MSKRVFPAICMASLMVLASCGGGGEAADPNAGADVLPNGMTVRAQIEARQEGYKTLGKNFKTINDQLKTSEPDLGEIETAIAAMLETSGGMADWYPEGTGPESGVETEALAVIWENPEGFAVKIADYEGALAGLNTAIQSGDFEAIGLAARATGATCGGCHDDFRLDD